MTKRPYRRVGRGQSSTRGKTSGRGGKGQTARAGHKIRPEMRDMIKKIPKLRGYGKNRAKTVNPLRVKPFALPLERVALMYPAGTTVTIEMLKAEGMVPARKNAVKLVGNVLETKLSFTGFTATPGAKGAIEKAGGALK